MVAVEIWFRKRMILIESGRKFYLITMIKMHFWD